MFFVLEIKSDFYKSTFIICWLTLFCIFKWLQKGAIFRCYMQPQEKNKRENMKLSVSGSSIRFLI